MRHQDDADSPSASNAARTAEREQLTTEIAAMVEGDAEAHMAHDSARLQRFLSHLADEPK